MTGSTDVISGTPDETMVAVWASTGTITGYPEFTYDPATGYYTFESHTDDNSLLIIPIETMGLINSPYVVLRTYNNGAPLDVNFHASRTSSTEYQLEITDTNGTAVATFYHNGNALIPGILEASKIKLTPATDPDLTAEGQLGWDSDEDALRGYDGTRQVVVSQVKKNVDFAIASPASLATHATRSTKSKTVWLNNTGFTLNITRIYAASDVDDYTFLLFKSNSMTDIGTTNDVQLDSVACSTNGTGMFYADITSGFDNGTIENGKYIIFEHSSGTCNDLQVHIEGWLDANVD